jgi:putative transposase
MEARFLGRWQRCWARPFSTKDAPVIPTESKTKARLKSQRQSLSWDRSLIGASKKMQDIWKENEDLMSVEQKDQIIRGVHQTCSDIAKHRLACDIVGINAKTLQRWVKADSLTDKRQTTIKHPTNKLSELEQARVIAIANNKEFANLPPSQIVPKLADKGEYIASESTMYRLLKAHGQLTKRTSSRVKIHPRTSPFTTTGPHQIFTWNITYVPTDVKGIFFYLYMVMDIFSCKIVGWQAHGNESSTLASDLMVDICRQENIKWNQVVLHSGNGSLMKRAMMLATLQKLSVMPSFSRPCVSNYNPLFRIVI